MGHRHVFLVFLALLLVAITYGGHAQAAAAAMTQQQGTDDGVVDGSMIGSRPPSCKGRCGWWCVGRSCEAVLVPIEQPQEHDGNNKQKSRRHGSGGGDGGSRASAEAEAEAQQRRLSAYEDGDYSNYKPIAWKCMCVGAS